jgi:hypothetical protein
MSYLHNTEYDLIITSGQNHTIGTHKKYYAKRKGNSMKRKYQDGAALDEIFDRIIETETPEIEEEKYNNLVETASTNTNHELIDHMQNIHNASTYHLAMQSSNPDTSNESKSFGSARSDIHKNGKKFQWISEEIDYLENYILSIEETQAGNRIAVCLNHLRYEASPDVQKFFHPFHLANSDRLKNGFNVAIERVRGKKGGKK